MLNVVIPMAGLGKRFARAGYKEPKPFIRFGGLPMILHVLDNIGVKARYYLLCNKRQIREYETSLRNALILREYILDFEILPIDGLTDGAARTVLLAKPFINSDKPLLIANSDQLVAPFDVVRALEHFSMTNADAGLMCFFSRDPKWSYAYLEDEGNISMIAEKQVISEHATCGIYYSDSGKRWIEAAERMIASNDRTNGEFYVAPVFNHYRTNAKIMPYFVNFFAGLGTPEDLQTFLGLV